MQSAQVSLPDPVAVLQYSVGLCLLVAELWSLTIRADFQVVQTVGSKAGAPIDMFKQNDGVLWSIFEES
jgi:hypothetical protein